MKRILSTATLMVLASGAAAYAVAPEAVAKAAADCCQALAACCKAVMSCCG